MIGYSLPRKNEVWRIAILILGNGLRATIGQERAPGSCFHARPRHRKSAGIRSEEPMQNIGILRSAV